MSAQQPPENALGVPGGTPTALPTNQPGPYPGHARPGQPVHAVPAGSFQYVQSSINTPPQHPQPPPNPPIATAQFTRHPAPSPPPAPPIEPNVQANGSRELFTHLTSNLNDHQQVFASLAEIDSGGAARTYEIRTMLPNGQILVHDIVFQFGASKQAGVNGISDEALLAVILDRLTCYQNGRYASRENAQARSRVQEALMWLIERSKRRIEVGLDGLEEKAG